MRFEWNTQTIQDFISALGYIVNLVWDNTLMTIDDIINRVIEAGTDPKDIVGCSKEYVDSLEQNLGVPLPESYREFLFKMGERAGYFKSDLDLYRPALDGLLPMQDYYRNEINKWQEHYDYELRAPNDAFIFCQSDGTLSYYFCMDTVSHDPAVFGPGGGKHPVKLIAPQFTDFLSEGLESLEDRIKRRNRRKL